MTQEPHDPSTNEADNQPQQPAWDNGAPTDDRSAPQWGQYTPPPTNYPPQGGQPNPQQGGQPYPQQGGQPYPQQGGQPYPQHGGQPFAQQPPQQPQWGQYAPGYAPGQPVGAPAGYQPPPGFRQYVAPPKPGVVPLRPLRVGEFLDGAFQAARANPKAIFGSALLFQLAGALLTIAVMVIGFSSLIPYLTDPAAIQSDEPSWAEFETLLTQLLTLLGVYAALGILQILAQLVLQGVLTIPVMRSTLNRKTSFGQMWRLAKPNIGSVIVVGLIFVAGYLVFAGVIGGAVFLFAITGEGRSGSEIVGIVFICLGIFLALIAVVIWLSIKFLFAPSVAITEGLGPIAALKRSWTLTNNNWWRILGINLLGGLIAGAVAQIISIPISLVTGLIPMAFTNSTPEEQITVQLVVFAITMLLSAVIAALTMAFTSAIMSLQYVDLRMRREGFDVTLLQLSEQKDDAGIPGYSASGQAGPGAAMNYEEPGV